MRKLSIINEALWSSSIKRSQGKEIRKEIQLNVSELESSVFLGGVWWSSDNLTIDGDENISINMFNKIPENVLKEWRLPTEQEFTDLVLKGYIVGGSGWNRNYIFEHPTMDTIGTPSVYLDSTELILIQKNPQGDGSNCMYIDCHGQPKTKKISDDVLNYAGQDIVVRLVRDNKN